MTQRRKKPTIFSPGGLVSLVRVRVRVRCEEVHPCRTVVRRAQCTVHMHMPCTVHSAHALHSAHAVPTPGIEELHVAVRVALLLTRRLGRVVRSCGCAVEGRRLRGGWFGSELGVTRCTHRLPTAYHRACMRMSTCMCTCTCMRHVHTARACACAYGTCMCMCVCMCACARARGPPRATAAASPRRGWCRPWRAAPAAVHVRLRLTVVGRVWVRITAICG